LTDADRRRLEAIPSVESDFLHAGDVSFIDLAAELVAAAIPGPALIQVRRCTVTVRGGNDDLPAHIGAGCGAQSLLEVIDEALEHVDGVGLDDHEILAVV